MVIKTTYKLLVLIFAFSSAFGQDHFLVDLSNRSPDVKTLVMSYEGSQAIPFQANDVLGNEQTLMAMNGKTVMLWFWHNDCGSCLKHIASMNKLAQKYPKDLQIVSFSNNLKAEIAAFTSTNQVDFPIIPNSKIFSEGPYGGDLGYPKLFILDNSGMIKWVIPEKEMNSKFGTFEFLESLHNALQQ